MQIAKRTWSDSLSHPVDCKLIITNNFRYSLVPDCAHGQNKHIMGIFCKTTVWIKNTGVEGKNLTPYKSLMGHYLKSGPAKNHRGMTDLKALTIIELLM